jgi:hypothetical protein
MTPLDAAKLLEVASGATPEQLEARFTELRTKLEDKIAKAPTPGLKEKYRASLAAITEAFETLVLASDASMLPVLRQEQPAAPPPVAPQRATATTPAASGSVAAPRRPATKKVDSNREFKWVVMLAIVVVIAGGWWILNTRAERERKEQAAAETARVAALEKQLKEEEEKIARERQEKLGARLRTQLAEARIAWEAFEKEERNTERALSELKSEVRSLRDAPATKVNQVNAQLAATQRYYDWLSDHLEQHPAKVARARLEELLSARMIDDAAAQMDDLQSALTDLSSEVPARRGELMRLEGFLSVQSDPPGMTFDYVDGFGNRRSGTTPATLSGVSPGPGTVTMHRPGYNDVQQVVTVRTGETVQAVVRVRPQQVIVRAEADVEFWSGGKFLARGELNAIDWPPQTYAIEMRRGTFTPFRFQLQVLQGDEPKVINYSFTELSTQSIQCHDCSGAGQFVEDKDCTHCEGYGSTRCGPCGGDGIMWVINGVVMKCFDCGGDGRVNCNYCSRNGYITERRTCAKCGGDGMISKLQLQ